MILYYVRHGNPIYNPDSLTALGKEQAFSLSKRFEILGLDEIYVSSSNRAIQTAEPTSFVLKKTPTVLDWAHEGVVAEHLWVNLNGTSEWCFHFPEVRNYLTCKQVLGLGDKFYTAPKLRDFSFKNCIDKVKSHTYEFLENLGYKFDEDLGAYKVLKENDKKIGFFAHSEFGRVFLSCVLNIPYPYIVNHFEMAHTGVTVLEFEKQGGLCIPTVRVFSDVSHLVKDGIQITY